MDIEGYARQGLIRSDPEIEEKLAIRITEIKQVDMTTARKIAQAAVSEARATLNVSGDILTSTRSGVTMGQFGVGSRGSGDFYAHEKIAEVIGSTAAVVDSSHLDDSGVVRTQSGEYIVLTVDGIHSRLSDFPFLAGFHVARASLRDVYVMGARPIALFSDIHVADDGDVAKIFDHIAGITTVSQVTGVPLITGSTLRIGGDMVIGDRMTGGVGAVGVTENLTSRNLTQPGDLILMTEGAGGGTISTTALYYGMHDVVDETINVKFIRACEALLESNVIKHVHSMTDVTNGGIRGDAKEICKTAGVGMEFNEASIRPLVNPRVFDMLDSLDIDYLGVSLDSLLVTVPQEYADEVIGVVRSSGVAIDVIGKVVKGHGAKIKVGDELRDFSPSFRESAYTPIKKMIGEDNPRDFDDMKKAIDRAAEKAIEKKRRVIEILNKK
ncbi:AIR synthase related protein domain protein [Methanosalsum zhilinae DSM 4017]|uniref:AIR synthase related protein domain protein n=1 Tax=Methanosalsum zhilinae (strain DSM 4017 / NBRC 107636 / OCM 62 / WeN5) TaxID=679901 RepID=F7XMK3_METZD|nr:AIR synthase-related protein [Methanosalsum zhilinae]AEH59930.1 AIR synthase related protein domain protein [Methanosalsum zhilinae DSM 4017]